MRKLFQLVGELTIDGMNKVQTGLTDVDKKAKLLTKKLNKMSMAAGNLGSSMTRNFTGPVLAVGAGLIFAAEKAGKYADQILDMAQITGLSTDTLQELENVARTAGVDFKQLTDSIQKFSGRLPMIAKEGGPAFEAVQKLGVNIYNTNGQVRDMNELFPEMISELQKMQNTTERNAIAQQIFGTRLGALAPVLGLTADQMEKSRKEAHELGLVMSEDALNAANEYRQESEKLRAEFTAFWRNIAMKVIPVFKDKLIPFLRDTAQPLFLKITDTISSLIDKFNNLSIRSKAIAVGFGVALVSAGPLLSIISKLLLAFKFLAPAIAVVNAALLSNPFALAVIGVAALTVAILGTVKAYKDAQKAHQKFSVITADQSQIDSFTEAVDKLTNKMIAYGDKLNEPKKAQELIGKEMEDLTKQARALGFTVEGDLNKKLVRLRDIANDLKGTVFDLKTGLVKTKKEQDDLGDSATTTGDKIKSLSKFQQDYAIKILNQQLQMTESVEKQTEIRLQINSIEREKAVKDATAKGEETGRIYKFYANKEIEIENQKNDELKKINEDKKKFADEWTAKLSDQNITIAATLSERTQLRLDALETEKENAIAAAEEKGNSINEINTYYKNEAIRIKKEEIDAKEQFEKVFEDRLKEMTYSKLELLREEKKEALAIAEELGADKQGVLDYYAEQEKMSIVDQVTFWVGQYANALGQLFNIFAMAYDNKLTLIDKNLKKEKKAIMQSTMNEQEKTDAIIALEKKADAEKLKIKQKAAKADKAAAIFGAIINTALGITAALKMGLPGIILAIIIGALGAVQIGMIAAQPLPFKEGAMIKGGKGGVTGIIGEAREDEIIMPLKTGVMALADALIARLSDLVPTGSIPVPAAAGEDEIIMPLKTGVMGLADALIARLSDLVPTESIPVPAAAGAGEFGNITEETHLHIGTFIGDQEGLKELERMLLPIRNSESLRRGDIQ